MSETIGRPTETPGELPKSDFDMLVNNGNFPALTFGYSAAVQQLIQMLFTVGEEARAELVMSLDSRVYRTRLNEFLVVPNVYDGEVWLLIVSDELWLAESYRLHEEGLAERDLDALPLRINKAYFARNERQLTLAGEQVSALINRHAVAVMTYATTGTARNPQRFAFTINGREFDLVEAADGELSLRLKVGDRYVGFSFDPKTGLPAEAQNTLEHLLFPAEAATMPNRTKE